MSQKDWLGSLQVGVARHDHTFILLCHLQKGTLKPLKFLDSFPNGFFGEEAQV